MLIVSETFSQNNADIQLAQEYLLKGEKYKALEIYRDLARSDANIQFIYNNYLNTLLDLSETEEALSLIKKIIKRQPDNILFQADVGIVYMRSGDLSRGDKYFRELINNNKNQVSRIKMLSDYLASRSFSDYSIQALTEARKEIGNPYLFCLELAMLYRVKRENDKMVQEYLTYVTQASANIQYVKNVMQALLTKPEELESLEKLLYERVQKNPEIEVYSDLLIWVTMQQKNFYGSFIQARAYDKRYKKPGDRTMEVAKVAADNDDYENAIKAFAYVVKEFPEGPNFLQAQLGLMRTREARIRTTYPVVTDSVKNLVNEYEGFAQRYPENPNTYEAQRNQALLIAMYLDDKDESIDILNKLVNNPRVGLQLKSKIKLDLGDIYLLKGEPWESTLLFSQVEKSLKENPVGYEAKLKNAKLFYYKGDFRVAQEHLDILKEATTREIANDAMDLSMRIKENIAIDSAGEALKVYASIELLLYQNKIDEALQKITQLKRGVSEGENAQQITISNHTILDDLYWLEANIRMQKGEFEQSIKLLQQILDEYSNDILSDDAFFLQGEIYERQLGSLEKAKEIYREFLNKFPGSVFAAEARKRYRTLRGDFINQPAPQVVPEF